MDAGKRLFYVKLNLIATHPYHGLIQEHTHHILYDTEGSRVVDVAPAIGWEQPDYPGWAEQLLPPIIEMPPEILDTVRSLLEGKINRGEAEKIHDLMQNKGITGANIKDYRGRISGFEIKEINGEDCSRYLSLLDRFYDTKAGYIDAATGLTKGVVADFIGGSEERKES